MAERLEDFVETPLDIKDLDLILNKGWGIQKEDAALIITDRGDGENCLGPALALEEVKGLKKIGCTCEIYLQEIKTALDKIDIQLLEKIKKLEPGSVVAVSVSNNVGVLPETEGNISFKKFILDRNLNFIYSRDLAQVKKKDWPLFAKAISFDASIHEKRWLDIKAIIDGGKEMVIKTDKGTDLHLDITGRETRLTCGYKNFGGTNLPFGEIFIAPVEDKSTGKVIVDGTSKILSGAVLVKDSFELEFSNGSIINNTSESLASTITHIKDNDPAGSKGIETLAELGIGLNPNAKLIGLMLVDEKTLGTAHVAIGNNTSFGGKNECKYHFDQVFRNPRIWVDGKEIKV